MLLLPAEAIFPTLLSQMVAKCVSTNNLRTDQWSLLLFSGRLNFGFVSTAAALVSTVATAALIRHHPQQQQQPWW